MKVILFITLFFHLNLAISATVFTTRGSESPTDSRQDYYIELLDLALKKTANEYGDYSIKVAPGNPNVQRALVDVKSSVYPNYFVRQSASDELIKEYLAVPFPLDLGITGYRIGFTSKSNNTLFKNITNLEQLKKLTIVQGLNWLDTNILKLNGFTVTTGSDYEGLFEMAAKGRADLFLRGVTEILPEWQTHKEIVNLTYEKDLLIYYPLPRFFFTSKENKSAAERVYQGLVIAYNDGSLMKLWLKYYSESIDFAELSQRKKFRLTNPFIKNIDPSYLQFIYQISTE